MNHRMNKISKFSPMSGTEIHGKLSVNTVIVTKFRNEITGQNENHSSSHFIFLYNAGNLSMYLPIWKTLRTERLNVSITNGEALPELWRLQQNQLCSLEEERGDGEGGLCKQINKNRWRPGTLEVEVGLRFE